MKKFTRTLSMLIAVIMCMSVFGIHITVSAAAASISYQFTGNNATDPGYAEGTISLTADIDGTYRLYWADDQNALDGYYRIGKLTLSAGKSGTVKLGYHTAIPPKATKVIACTDGTSVSSARAVYQIPSNKLTAQATGDLLYKFSSYSDIHIDRANGWYCDSDTHWAEGLKYAADHDSDYIIVSGDCITNDNGPTEEWKAYQKIIKESDFTNPIWESDGNHDLHQGVEYGLEKFIAATGLDSTSETLNSGRSYYYEVEKNTGDVFIFMSIELNKAPADAEIFSEEQLAWAESLIREYTARGVNVFLVQHSPIRGYGAGDRKDKPYYSGTMNPDLQSAKKFKAMLEKYPNVMWVSGHTHEDFSMDYNYSDEDGTSAHMLHIPALAGSKLPKSTDDALDANGGKGFNAQGFYTEVYENKIIFYGVNVADGTIYSSYCYIMDSIRDESVNKTEEEQELSGNNVSISSKLTEASAALSDYYTCASYNQYQALKKLYNTYKNKTTADQVIYDEFTADIKALKDISSAIGQGQNTVGHEYYFENNLSWSKVYAYAWTGSNHNAEWPGVKISKTDTNNGHDMYKVTFNSDGEYQNLIFTDGSSQTVDISLTQYKYNTFVTDGTSSGKYKVKNYPFHQDVIEEDSDNLAMLHYISGVHDWSDKDSLMVRTHDGKFEYTFLADSSKDISLCIYDKTNNKYFCPGESANISYRQGLNESYALSTQTSNSHSITVKGLSEGKRFMVTYDPKNATMTVTSKGTAVSEIENTSTLSAETIKYGEQIAVNTSATGGTAPYTYTVKYKKSNKTVWTTILENKPSSAVTITPGSATDYDVLVIATDSSGKSADKILKFHVLPGLTNKSTISASRIVIGGKVTVQANAEGGSGDYQYAVFYRKLSSTNWVTKQNYSTNPTVTIKPGSQEDYEICVKVKDSKGAISKKYYTLTVSAPLVLNGTISSESIKLGESVTLSASASEGTGGYLYGFYYKKTSSSKWTEKQAYRSNSKVSIKPASATTYDVCIKVKDSSGTIVKQYFKVSVTK